MSAEKLAAVLLFAAKAWFLGMLLLVCLFVIWAIIFG